MSCLCETLIDDSSKSLVLREGQLRLSSCFLSTGQFGSAKNIQESDLHSPPLSTIMTYSEKSSVGATILPSSDLPKPSYPAVILEKPSLESLDSSYAMSAANHMPASKEEYDPTSTNPCSAFYSHPTTRTSFEQQKTESKTNIRIYEHDLESGSQVVVPMKRESKALVEKIGKKDLCCQRRSFNPMRRLSKKQKIWVKMIIALVIIGAAVGLGLGIALVTLSYSANHRACLLFDPGTSLPIAQ